MQTMNRAWVLLDNQERSRFTRAGMEFFLRNFGRSPATISIIHPGATFDGERPDDLKFEVEGQPVPGPIPERILAPDRLMRVGFRWSRTPNVRPPFEFQLRIEYADAFEVYEYHLCLRRRRPGSRILVECPYNQRTRKNQDPFRPLE